MQREQVQSLIMELRSQMLCGLTKKFFKKVVLVGILPSWPFLEKEMAAIAVFLPWNPMNRRSRAGYSPWGCKSRARNLATKPPHHFFLAYCLQRTLLKSLSLCFSSFSDTTGFHSRNCSKMIKEKLPNWLLSSLSHCSYSSNSLITILPLLDMRKMEVWVTLRKKIYFDLFFFTITAYLQSCCLVGECHDIDSWCRYCNQNTKKSPPRQLN